MLGPPLPARSASRGPFYDRALTVLGAALGGARVGVACFRGERFGAEATLAALVAIGCAAALVRDALL